MLTKELESAYHADNIRGAKLIIKGLNSLHPDVWQFCYGDVKKTVETINRFTELPMMKCSNCNNMLSLFDWHGSQGLCASCEEYFMHCTDEELIYDQE